jgi:sugar lactone lactonase YvrE
MIKFLRKNRQNLLSEGKTGKYFKYAIGEIIHVFIGILIALQINIWNKILNLKKQQMKPLTNIVLLFIILLVSCNQQITKNEEDVSKNTEETSKNSNKKLPYLTFKDAKLFPGNGSLLRAEDGVSLNDGRILVVDQATGLRLLEKDGSNRPFGNFKDAGFVHNPPEKIAGPNGMVLEHDGKHVLMCDVADGKVYRTNIATEQVELIYDHPYGVNSIYSDKTGAIWFTQCANNTTMAEMFAEINLPFPHGAVYRMKNFNSKPEIIKDSLYFANGITMDKAEKTLYVSESMMDRIHAFKVDTSKGKTQYSGVIARISTPDNIAVDDNGNLIVASPMNNQIVAVDFKNHSQHIVFDASTPENQEMANEWSRRSRLGMARGDLISPSLFNPVPGLLTGMFFSKDGKTLYIANLGNDLLKLDYR